MSEPTTAGWAGDTARVRLRPWILIRAIAKHVWRARGRQIKRRLPWVAGTVALLYVMSKTFPLGIIWSPSVAPSLVIVRPGAAAQIGELAAYRYSGRKLGDYRAGDKMIHWVIAGEGSVVSVRDRMVFVDGRAVGYAKDATYRDEPLTPIAPRVIPKNYYYVMGTHPGALDSRYDEAGLLHVSDLIGRAWVIF